MNREPLSVDPAQADGALRAQLSEIAAAGQLLLRRAEEKDKEYLAGMCRAAFRAMRIVNNRALARRLEDEDELRAVFATMDLVDWGRELTEHLTELLEPTGIALSFQTELVSLVTLGDGELLEQMIYALVSNAVKAMKGGGRLWISLGRSRKNAVLTVGDEGPGLSGEALARIFPEEELGPDLTPGAGAGFGLRLARTIAELHGGLMMLETMPGGGVRAAAALPLREGGRDRLESPAAGEEGLDRALVALSDVLPLEVFLPPR